MQTNKNFTLSCLEFKVFCRLYEYKRTTTLIQTYVTYNEFYKFGGLTELGDNHRLILFRHIRTAISIYSKDCLVIKSGL